MTRTKKHIALICPGGPITKELAAQTGEIAAARYSDEVQLHFHPQCFRASGHFAGNDATRSDAFLEVANDPAYHAVWFARGGYGACRLDDKIFTQLNEHAHRKTYLGYSDTGMLLARLYKMGVGRSVHGPMPSDLPREGGDDAITRALDYLVNGGTSGLEPTASSHPKAVAFNITVLTHLLGTNWTPDLSGHVIMLEDVSEYLYSIDRAMFSITADPGVQKAAGVMLGRISDVPENDRPFGETEEEIIQRWCLQRSIPYLGRADIGHDAGNKIVPFGAPSIA